MKKRELYKIIDALISIIQKDYYKNSNHGYYLNGRPYTGQVYLHGGGQPFTDGHGNILEWR